MDAAEHLYYASHSWNPFFFQGTKTIAYEIVEQLGGRAPDTFVVPAGNGTLLLGANLGFAEMLQAGHIRRLPRIVAVQAEKCAPLARAFEAGQVDAVEIEAAHTLAEGIAIPSPVRARQILAAVRESGGAFVRVSEEQIAAAFRRMCRCGHYIEPTSAATIAGVERYVADRPEDEVVVSMFTGHGLKSTEKIMHVLAG
jgi:threonine synthase